MNNKVDLNDDELSLVMTALTLTLFSYTKWINKNGEDNLPLSEKTVRDDMQKLYDRLNEEYY